MFSGKFFEIAVCVLVGLVYSVAGSSEEIFRETASQEIDKKQANTQELVLVAKNVRLQMGEKESLESLKNQLEKLASEGWAFDIQGQQMHIKAKNSSSQELKLVLPQNLSSLQVLAETFQGDLSKFHGKLSIKAKKLQIEAEQSEGNWEVSGRELRAKIDSHKGALKLYGQNADTQLGSGEGNLFVESFSGKLKLGAWVGDSQLQIQKGEVRVEGGEGDLNIASQGAHVSILDRNGKLKVKSVTGNLKFQLQEGAKLRAYTEEGSVNVRLPNSSGAHVNIGTKEGDMNFPRYLELKRYPQMKVATGRLRGRLAGSIYIRTDKGKIDLH